MTALAAEAHALTAFREVRGEGRAYTATTFPADPRGGCERFVRMCRAVGWISDSITPQEAYAVLDVIDADWNIVGDFLIPTADAFQGIKRKLGLEVRHVEEGRD